MKRYWIFSILTLVCLLIGVYFYSLQQTSNDIEQYPSKPINSDLVVKETPSTPENTNKDLSENQSEKDSTDNPKKDSDKDVVQKQETKTEKADTMAKKSGSVINISFKPALTDDWLIEKQRIYDQERSEAIALANSMGMPLERSDLFLRGVQANRLLYYTTQNVNAAISTGANLVRDTAPYFVNGSGITMGVWDAGSILPTHQEFDLRVTVKDGASPHYHATHVGGTIGGDGANSGALGMAPQVLIDSYEWNNDITEMGSRGARYPGDVNRIQISNHSYGVISGWAYDSFSGSLGWHWLDNITTLTESFFGQYNSEAADFDEIAQNDPYYLIFKSAGNDRSDGPFNGNTIFYWNGSGWTSTSYNSANHPKGDGVYKSGYDTIPTAGNAKNILTIGAVHDAVTAGNRDISKATMSSFSGWGPTDDGRIKPDVVGNGISLLSADSATMVSYVNLSGTSMSSPNVSGSAVLLQDYFDNKFPSHMLRSSSIKGLIIATADDIGPTGPDYQNGWGLVNIKNAIDLIGDYATNPGNRMLVEGKLISGTNSLDQYIYESEGLSPLMATIAWTDPKGVATNSTDSVTSRLVNNLNLKVTAPDGTTIYYPFKLDGTNPSSVATTGLNNVDNVEQVKIASPVAGLYAVQIDFSGSLSGGSQYYSLNMQGVKKNVVFGLPSPINYTLGATIGSQQEIFINGSNFLLGAHITLYKTGYSNVVVTNQQVTPESIKGFIPINTISTLDWEIRVTNPDNKIGSSIPKPTSMINNLVSNTILTGSSITLTGTSSSLGEAITSVKIVIDNTIEYQAINTGTDFSTWSYQWNLVTEAGTIAHNIKTIAYTNNFQEQTPIILSNITIDNITPAVIISSNNNITTELGGFAFVSMKLQKKPASDVVISFYSNNTSEGTLSKNSLTFTNSNWFTPQTFNVIGVNELIDDDDKIYSVVIDPLTSTDLAYNLMDPSDLTFTNQDNDTAAVIVTGSNLVVTETLINSQFQVRLASEPTVDVTVNITTSDTSEGTISTSSILFTPFNWMNDVSVTISGVDDLLADGDFDFLINFPSITSSDSKYSSNSIPNINVKCLDNENVGLNISSSSPFSYEGATSAVLTFTLMSQPTSNVTYSITSNGTSQVSLSASTLTFTNANWNQPKNITITAINDFIAENDFNLVLNFGPASTSNLHYLNNFRNFSLTVKDNDIVGFIVSPISGNINENGATAFFDMSLSSQPSQNVEISLISSNTAEATLSVSTHTFNSSNWNIVKRITVIPIDDSNFDGDISFTVLGTISTNDIDYQLIIFPNVNVLSVDDDIPSVLVTANSSTVTEGGGIATASIRLKLAPTAEVSVPILSSDLTEGTVSPNFIIFTTANWSDPQTIVLTGVNDSMEDGNINFNLITGSATSSDGSYNGLSGPVKTFINLDDDDFTPPVITLNGNGEMNLRLGSIFVDPLASSFDAKEGVLSNIMVSGSVNSNQLGDYILSYTAADSKGNLSNAVIRKVSVINSAGVNIAIKDYLIKEDGGVDSFSLSLKDAPNSNVVLDISVEGTGVSVLPNSISFNITNWNQNQTITISSIPDNKVSEITGKIKIEVNKPLSESNYSIVSAIYLNYTLIEDDENGFDISTKNLLIPENAGKGEVAISLRAEPNNDVLINMMNPAIDRFAIEPAQLRFTKLNWNNSQKFKIISIDNNSPSGNLSYKASISIDASSDEAFLSLDSAQMSKEIVFSQINEDVAGIIVSNDKLLVGPSLKDNFTIKLSAQPKENVSMTFSSDNSSLSFSPGNIEFDSINWSIEQTITVVGTVSVNTSANIDLTIDPLSDLDFISIKNQTVNVLMIASENDLVAIYSECNVGGSISPSGSVVVQKNSLISFSVEPSEGFDIEKILIDGNEIKIKNQFSFSAVKEAFVKVFFIRKNLIPISEADKSIPSQEQLDELTELLNNPDSISAINLEIVFELSHLKLTENENTNLLLSLKQLIESDNNLKDLDIPLVVLLNLQSTFVSDVNKSLAISMGESLLKNSNMKGEQSTQLLKVMNAILNESTAEFLVSQKTFILGILTKINQIQLAELKSSEQSKNEIILDKIKMIIKKVDMTNATDQSFSQDTGASEVDIPSGVFSMLKSQGHLVLFFNEINSPFDANEFLDKNNIPVSDISRIEMIDADLNTIEINNLLDAITIKIPINQALLNSLKVNETIKPMFYDPAKNKWSTFGISSIEQTTEFIIFKVNHLTEFALFKVESIEPITNEPSPIDTPIQLNPAPATSGGGGGCSYSKAKSQSNNEYIYLLLVLLYFFNLRRQSRRKVSLQKLNNK